MASIDHVVVLALENRSFDHLLGYLDHPDASFDGLRGAGPYTNPGMRSGEVVSASPVAKTVLPVDPDHSHDAVMGQLGMVDRRASAPTNEGFVASYERKGRGRAVNSHSGPLGWLVDLFHRWSIRVPPLKAATVDHGVGCQNSITPLTREFAGACRSSRCEF